MCLFVCVCVRLCVVSVCVTLCAGWLAGCCGVAVVVLWWVGARVLGWLVVGVYGEV